MLGVVVSQQLGSLKLQIAAPHYNVSDWETQCYTEEQIATLCWALRVNHLGPSQRRGTQGNSKRILETSASPSLKCNIIHLLQECLRSELCHPTAEEKGPFFNTEDKIFGDGGSY